MMLAIPFNMAASLLLAVLLNREDARYGDLSHRLQFCRPSPPDVGTMLLWMWMFNKDLGSINQVLALGRNPRAWTGCRVTSGPSRPPDADGSSLGASISAEST